MIVFNEMTNWNAIPMECVVEKVISLQSFLAWAVTNGVKLVNAFALIIRMVCSNSVRFVE